MYSAFQLTIKPEYYNFGKEPFGNDPSWGQPLRKLLLEFNGKVMVDADYPDKVVIAIANDKDVKKMKEMVSEVYEVMDVTSYLSKEGIDLMKQALNVKL